MLRPRTYRGRSAYRNPYTPTKVTVSPNQDMSAPPDQVDKMDAATFFAMFAQLMKASPPHANDYPILDRLKRLGIEPGKSYALSSAPKEVQAVLNAAPAEALPRIKAAWLACSRMDGAQNLTAIGTYGADYLHRAGVAFGALGANVPDDAVYPTAFVDADGLPFSSEKRYILHFEKGQLPPARAFWSLTMTYDLRRLRLHGMIVRIPKTHRYRVTPFGLRAALFFTRVHARLYRPSVTQFSSNAPSPKLSSRPAVPEARKHHPHLSPGG